MHSPVSTFGEHLAVKAVGVASPADIQIALLTGGFDRPYAFGLAMALVAKGIAVDVIGSDEIDSPEMHSTPNLRFVNLWRSERANGSFTGKLVRIVRYYGRLIRYAALTQPKTFHILWNNKVQIFDRTLLMLYYKAQHKKVVITAHNVNQGKRDANDSLLNRVTLRMQYRLADHIFVHTHKMKDELMAAFGVRECAVTVLRHPINNAFPDTDLTPVEAKKQLGVSHDERAILFLGRITPYKGLEYLLSAFQLLATSNVKYRLIIAGELKKGNESYLDEIRQTIDRELSGDRVIQKIQFIPDSDMELYLKAADVLVLPYKDIFQSGILFLAYSFGLPVVATDVGSFREEIVEGKTGFICRPADPVDMARTIETYFASDLYRDLKNKRQELRKYAHRHHSWDAVGELTRKVYAELAGRHAS